jgi:hypothetical protein
LFIPYLFPVESPDNVQAGAMFRQIPHLFATLSHAKRKRDQELAFGSVANKTGSPKTNGSAKQKADGRNLTVRRPYQ